MTVETGNKAKNNTNTRSGMKILVSWLVGSGEFVLFTILISLPVQTGLENGDADDDTDSLISELCYF